MAKIRTAIDLNTGALLEIAVPTVFKTRAIDKDNYYPIEVDSEGKFTVENRGTAITPCALTIIPKADILTFTVEGLSEEPLTFSRIKSGQTLVLDGAKRQITIDGQDAMSSFDGWEFPKLQPGINHVKINNAYQMYISISLEPRFI